MTTLLIPSMLRSWAGADRIEVSGDTVEGLLVAAESECPGIRSRVMDERGTLRPHVKVFVNGEMVDLAYAVDPQDEVKIIPAISGGADGVELLVGTRKGLFVIEGQAGDEFQIKARSFAGSTVEFALRDRRTGTYYAAVTNGWFGPRIYYTDDPAGEWTDASGVALPEDSDTAIERIWVIRPGEAEGELWAGAAPASLFHSTDGGRTWELNRGLWEHPTRDQWGAGLGGQCVNSIAPWPGDPNRLAIGISAAGVWISDDRGDTWERGGKGLIPRYMPEEQWDTTFALCVHNMHRCTQVPDRLYMQFHGGVYRSDDAGYTWSDISADSELPADFGFPLVIDPRNPERAFVIPLIGGEDRVPPEGKLNVYETRDGGSSWQVLGHGLPQQGAYLTILRQAFASDEHDDLGLYFGAESGEVFAYSDATGTWSTAMRHLAPVTSVRVA